VASAMRDGFASGIRTFRSRTISVPGRRCRAMSQRVPTESSPAKTTGLGCIRCRQAVTDIGIVLNPSLTPEQSPEGLRSLEETHRLVDIVCLQCGCASEAPVSLRARIWTLGDHRSCLCSSLWTRDFVIDVLSDGCAVSLASFMPGHALCVVSSEGSAMRFRHVVETSTTYGGFAPFPSRPRRWKARRSGSRRETCFQNGFSSNYCPQC